MLCVGFKSRVLLTTGIILVIIFCYFLNPLIVTSVTESMNVPNDHLFPNDLTLINITNFSFILNNDICDINPLTIIIIIHSATANTEARDIIR